MKSFITSLVIFFAVSIVCQAQTGWFPQNWGISTYLQDVSFTDANHGTAVGPFGMILRTTNGGTTWTQQPSGSTTLILQSVSFTDANTGTIVGAGGTILRTTNGGASWTPQVSGTAVYLWDVSFTDANNGTVVGNSGTILRTTNGGATWSQQASGTLAPLVGVSFVDANNGTVVGDNGTILRTTNGGATWIPQNSGTTNNLFRTSFTDANTGTIIGAFGTILRTINGGVTWVQQSSGTTERLLDVDFTDASNGTIVGDFGTILRTTNGGTTWAPQSSGTTRDLHGVSFSSTNTGTVVGGQGTILRMAGPASCNPPSNVSMASVSSTEVTATWSMPAGSSNFEIEVNQTSTPPAGAGVPVTGDSTVIGSLNGGTAYYFHIRTNCGGGDFSNWVSIPFTTSGVTGNAEVLTKDDLIAVYPNPATDKVTVLNIGKSSGKLSLLDANGRILKTQQMNDEITTVDLSELSRGFYFVHFLNSEQYKVQVLQKW